jgi:hypothetical protein
MKRVSVLLTLVLAATPAFAHVGVLIAGVC